MSQDERISRFIITKPKKGSKSKRKSNFSRIQKTQGIEEINDDYIDNTLRNESSFKQGKSQKSHLVNRDSTGINSRFKEFLMNQAVDRANDHHDDGRSQKLNLMYKRQY